MKTRGQPVVLGSSVFGPAASGHASASLTTPSLSRSGSGGQPVVFGSPVGTPATSGHASSPSGTPSPSRSAARAGGGGGIDGGAANGVGSAGAAGAANAGAYSSDASARKTGVPAARERPGP